MAHLDIREVHKRLDGIVGKGLSPGQLRERLEALRKESGSTLALASYRYAQELADSGDVALWVFLRGNISLYGLGPDGKRRKSWGSPAELEAMLRFFEAQNDDENYRYFFSGLHGRNYQAVARERIAALLEEGVGTATLGRELRRLGWALRFDEELALELYRQAPTLARTAILKGLPYPTKGGGVLLPALLEATEGDDDFHFKLYRRCVDEKKWRKDVDELLLTVSDEDLADELERRHLTYLPMDVGEVQATMLERRGEAALPYLFRKLQVYRWGQRDGGFEQLIKAAKALPDDAFYAFVLRNHGQTQEFNKALSAHLRAGERRLVLRLAGAGAEFNGPGFGYARVQPLSDDVAVLLYDEDPELLRGPYRRSIYAGYHQQYPKLFERLVRAEDEELIDFLASRYATRMGWGGPESLKSAENISRYYEQLLSNPEAFALRGARVLGQVPAFGIWNYRQLLKNNRLARLLYEHKPEAYLQSPEAIAELIEASEIHAQQLGFRVLSLPGAVAHTAPHLRSLSAAILRPLHRRTRALVFGAVRNASTSPELAEVLLRQLREALHLPEKAYPIEELVGLVADILHRHPQLRDATEAPVVYGADLSAGAV